MGGLIAALYTAVRKPELAGLLLSGPAVSAPGKRMRAAAVVAGGAARLVPGLRAMKLAAAEVSRDAAVVESYRQDPLVYHGGVPASTIAALVRAARRLRQDAGQIRVPLLIVHGTADSLVPSGASQELFDRVSSNDRVFKEYEGLYHEVLNEPEKERVFADIRAWLDAHG
jgi:alpha-beta hydrolase superfamily lysophospholipase